MLLLPVSAGAVADATFHRDRALHGLERVTKNREAQRGIICSDNCASTPLALEQPKVEEDGYNRYLYSSHFRAIYSKVCSSSLAVEQYVMQILEIAEEVYETEVVEFGLSPPRGGDSHYTDIYLGQRTTTEDCRGYNYTTGSKVDWPTEYMTAYAGYASQYITGEGNAFLVLNASLSGAMLQVTLAHEIFHTIQFSYKNFDFGDDRYLDEDRWLLEAMATAIESKVYPEADDYINYVNHWYQRVGEPLDTFDGAFEYGSAIVVLYMIEQFGIEVMAQMLELFSTMDGWFELLNNLLTEQLEIQLPLFYQQFIEAVWNPDENFADGDQFAVDYLDQQWESSSLDQPLLLERLAMRPVQFEEDTLVLDDPNLHQVSLAPDNDRCTIWEQQAQQKNNLFCQQGERRVLFTDLQSLRVERPYRNYQLMQGWNLIGIGRDDQRSLSSLPAALFGEAAVQMDHIITPDTDYVVDDFVAQALIQGVEIIAIQSLNQPELYWSQPLQSDQDEFLMETLTVGSDYRITLNVESGSPWVGWSPSSGWHHTRGVLVSENASWRIVNQEDPATVSELRPAWSWLAEPVEITVLGEEKEDSFADLQSGWNLIRTKEQRLASQSDLGTFRNYITEQSGMHLQRILLRLPSGVWRHWDYSRASGNLRGIRGINAFWIWLE